MANIEIIANIFIVIVVLFFMLSICLIILSIIICIYNILFIPEYTDENIEMTNLDFSNYIIPIDINEEECVICFDNLDEQYKVKMINCNHIFHKECINKWLNVKRTCPCCRTSIYENIELIV